MEDSNMSRAAYIPFSHQQLQIHYSGQYSPCTNFYPVFILISDDTYDLPSDFFLYIPDAHGLGTLHPIPAAAKSLVHECSTSLIVASWVLATPHGVASPWKSTTEP